MQIIGKTTSNISKKAWRTTVRRAFFMKSSFIWIAGQEKYAYLCPKNQKKKN
jgi:hypothetical protein